MKKIFLIKLIGSAFHIGFAPKAPGTFGSLFAVLVYIVVLRLLSDNYLLLHIILTVLFIVLSFVVGTYVKEAFGDDDPKEFVLDEVAGQMVALLPLSVMGIYNYYLIFLSFSLFRFFDIIKPFPVSFFDKKFKNSFGITMDDVVAGGCTSILTFAFLLLFF